MAGRCGEREVYAELHCHSAYSFQEGASFPHELLLRARELGYPALALTDHDSLAGAMDFAQTARSLGIQPIVGAELTLKGGHHLTLLAATREGYGNLCRLLSYTHVFSERRHPEADPGWLRQHSKGLIALTGCPRGLVPSLAARGDMEGAEAALRCYLECFGSDNVFVELHQNLVKGDTHRNRRLYELARSVGVGVVATNNVHYHLRERHRLHDALVAIRSLKTLEESHKERRANSEFYLKSAQEMVALFQGYPEAIANTLRIAERCSFDLSTDLGYRFPDYPVPSGYTPLSYLRHICEEAAYRKYGRITPRVRERLEEELRRTAKHGLAGFFLIYYDLINLARQVMLDLGLGDPEVPLEENPPGRGRGSSVAMLVGYLIGLSHIDPLQYDLGLDRFLPEDLASAPDIDLDFPRNIREELIKRIHEKYGWEHAALVGAISTYQARGVVRDLGKVLGLPPEQVDKLAKRIDNGDARNIRQEMGRLPEFRDLVDAPGWRDLVRLAPQMAGLPKGVQQHPGGMVISTTPLTEMVPVMPGAIEGRYVMQWDKEAVDQAGMVKIDFLSLGTLSQMQEAVQLVEKRTGKPLDLSRIDFEDRAVYRMLAEADTVGVFQVESAAQMQTLPRMKPTCLRDMAFEVAAVRPGVGANDGVTHFIRRRLGLEPVTYHHPLEKPTLERTLGVILYQDQVIELAMHVAGFSAREGDQMRRAFAKKNNQGLLRFYWERFREGAEARGVPTQVAKGIFKKFNGMYQFPESHSYAFGITAYQMAYLKLYYPLEFYVALFNAQPMGFWDLETIKEDARRHGVAVLNPNVNRSKEKCAIEGEAIRLGFLNVRGIGEVTAKAIVEEREARGPFTSLKDFMERTGLLRKAVENLVQAGALDCFKEDRRRLLWQVGLRYHPPSKQLSLALPVGQDMAELPTVSPQERMLKEYGVLGLFPSGHILQQLRPHLKARGFVTSQELRFARDGQRVKLVGRVARPLQHPLANAFFITLEDEYGFIPLIIWPNVYARYRVQLREPLITIEGVVSRREGTLNVIVERASLIRPKSGDPSKFLRPARPMFR